MPIGIVDASWGGAPLAAFTPLTTIASDPALQPAILHWSRMAEDPVITQGAFDSQNLAFWEAARAK